MSLTSELEKLASLRDRGDLSPAEFEKAKALLLSGEGGEAAPPEAPAAKAAGDSEKQRKTYFLVAFLTTVAATLSGVSAAISPSAVSFGNLMMWGGLSVYWWVYLSRMKTAG